MSREKDERIQQAGNDLGNTAIFKKPKPTNVLEKENNGNGQTTSN